MKTLLLSLLFSVTVFSQGIPPGNKIPVGGKDYYLLGANFPWGQYWNNDFSGAVANNTASFNSKFADMKARGVHVVRWWIFSDGKGTSITYGSGNTPTGLHPDFLRSMDSAVALAKRHNMFLVPVFFSFEYLYTTGRPEVFMDPAKTNALIANVIDPIMKRYPNEPHILAWELINEPELYLKGIPGESFQSTGAGVTMQQFWNLASKVGNSVHTYTKSYYTIGATGLKWIKIWQNSFADKKGLPRPNFDFYTAHYYTWMDPHCQSGDPDLGTLCQSPLKQKYSDLGMDHPVVIGELPGNLVSDAQMKTIYDNGWAGYWPWAHYPGTISVNWAPFTAWEQANKSLVDIQLGAVVPPVDPVPLPPPPPVVTAFSASLSVSPLNVEVGSTVGIFGNATQTVSNFDVYINGVKTYAAQLSTPFTIEYQPSQSGMYTIGGFARSTGGTWFTIPNVTLTVKDKPVVVPPVIVCNLDSADQAGYARGRASVDTLGVIERYKAKIPNEVSKTVTVTIPVPKP